MAEVISGKQFPFQWEGKDRKGNRVRGRGLAKTELEMRSDLRRQGIAATQGAQGKPAVQERRQGHCGRHRDLRPPAGHDAHGGHPDGAGVRDHRCRTRQARGAEARAVDQVRHRDGQRAEPGAGQASALFRRPVREPGRGRRTCWRARDGAREDRDLQGKDRGAEEEDQEGPVLPGSGAGRCGHRDGNPADFRDPAVREPVQGLRRGPSGVHAVRRGSCRAGCRRKAGSY